MYREIRQGLVDMGEMFDLLEQPAEIIDREDATELNVTGGHIAMKNITFGYDEKRPIIQDVSLEIHSERKLQ